MTNDRFEELTQRYANLRIAVIGDFCLDRYLEIDSSRPETSIETGLPVFNVTRVRAQPGGAGTIVNNLAALGVGTILPVGFAGIEGEGYELVSALRRMAGVRMDYFSQTPSRRTFTYCKPLICETGKPPRELNRLDSKNWDSTPVALENKVIALLMALSSSIDALIVLDQVDVANTGVVTQRVLAAIGALAKARTDLLIIADCRRGLRDYPAVCFKMNRTEFNSLAGGKENASVTELKVAARALAKKHGRAVFVTLAEEGVIGALPGGEVQHSPALPVRGEIDVVGAGDSVTANMTASIAAGATLEEALRLANAAASVVVHQLGTTGTATMEQLQPLVTRS